MSGVTIRPGSDTYLPASVALTGGATGFAVTSDNTDTTYASASAFVGWPKAVLRMKPAAGGLGVIGASQRIKAVRINAKVRMNAAASGQSGAIKLAMRSASGNYDSWEVMSYNDAITFVTRFGTWRNTPPRGTASEWTVNLVEQTSVEIAWNPCAFAGTNLRVSEVYWDIDYRTQATLSGVSITNPTGTVNPTVQWTFNPNGDGDPQVAYQVKVFRSDQYTAFGFNPATSLPVWDSGVVIGNAAQAVVARSLNNGFTYIAYVRAAADFNGSKWYASWANSAPATILLAQLPFPTMQTLTPSATPPFIRNRIDVQGNWNLLSAQDASFGSSGVGTWSVFFGGANLARVTTPVAEGAGAMSITKTAAVSDTETLTANGTLGYRVKAGQVYTALASFRAATVSRSCSVGIAFSDRTGAGLGLTYGTAVTDTTTGYTQASAQVTAPAGAVFAATWFKITAQPTSEVHYVDRIHTGTNVVIGSGTVVGQTGVTQPVVAAKYDSGYWSGGSVQVPLPNVPAAALLVAVTCSGQSASTTTNVASDTGGTGLTWTNRQENATANTGDASVSTAYFAAGGTSAVTITASGNQSSGCRTWVYAVTGHDEAAFGGASVKASATSGSANVSLTTTRENSLVIVGIGDFNAVNGNARSYRQPGLTLAEDFYGDFGGGSTYFAHSIRPGASVGTEGLLSPSGQAYGIVAIEIRGATVNNIQTVYTGWSTGGLVGTGSTVVERALVATGNRNNAHPQLWSGGDWYKSTDGFYLPNGQVESGLTYDNTDRFDGEGSIRWNVNNKGSKLFMGWPDGPRLIGEPQEPLFGIEGTTYTFSLYAKASTTFSSTLVVQALDQFGAPVGSPGTASISITTGWTQFSAAMTMPTGALWVVASLANTASVTEQRVWVDGIQWVEGTTIDTIPQFGMGIAVDWQPVRGADQGEFIITDTEAALVDSVFDNEAPPGYGVAYRAYNYLPATDTIPAFGSPPTFYVTSKLPTPGRGVWVLRDPLDATLAMQVHVIEMTESMHEEAQTFYPLRPTTWDQLGQRAVTITDFIGGFDGSLKIVCDSEREWLLLRQLLSRPRPLWLIFPEHGARYIRITDRSWDRTTPRTSQVGIDSIWRRTISVNFLESEAP